MRILFVHQNFPAQFLHLAPALASRGHECQVLTDATNKNIMRFKTTHYDYKEAQLDASVSRLGRNYTLNSDRGVVVARAAVAMRKQGYLPDVIVGHSGWGETLFLKEVWPEAKLIIYSEFYYKGRGADLGFDPEFSKSSFDQIMIAQGRAAHQGQALIHADAGMTPTHWQASTHPVALQRMLTVMHDGIDTQRVAPNPDARLVLPDGQSLTPQDEVLTFVNRNLEPYRGYHIFMRALPAVLQARPKAQVVIIGGDGTSYGTPPKGQTGWKGIILDEVRDQLDLSRVHFLGKVPYPQFLATLQVSRAHAYLTYPFVLSWSMIEAMAAGCHIVASATAPVLEALEQGKSGTLVDFFDVAGWSKAMTEALADPDRFAPQRAAARAAAIKNYDLRSNCLPKLIRFVEGFGPAAASTALA
ncbi:glycosyltransferase [Cypionkella sp.]|uniref:glycosyltransferase n=1 Tax=Cypionkella sp. TaxID=2811411 RepID=UPI0037528B77